MRDCINAGNEEFCRQISPYVHCYWKDLNVKNECVCVDNRICIPNSIKDAYVKAIHATHPGSWGMTDTAIYVWWPFMHRDLLIKTAKCNPCVKIGKNLKSTKLSSNWVPLKLCKVPNEETQIDFGGPIYNEKNQEVYFLACIDRFSEFPTAEVAEISSRQRIIAWHSSYNKSLSSTVLNRSTNKSFL